MSAMTWWEYVQSVSGGATNAAIAERIGVSAPSVSRWKDGHPDPARARDFAKAYGRPVLEAFIVAGFLTPEEADEQPAGRLNPAEMDDEELIAEIWRRFKEGGPDGRQPEAEKMIMTDGGADGESGEGGGPTLSGQIGRRIPLHGKARRRNKDA